MWKLGFGLNAQGHRSKSIVIFDLAVTSTSPAGSCVLAEISGLRLDYDIVVFSEICDIASEPGITWIRVPLPRRPVFIRYWIFLVVATLRYLAWRIGNPPPSFIQTTQGQFLFPTVSYAHFCHRAYLRDQWPLSTVSGTRRVARWLNHKFNSLLESNAFSRARKIVVPSQGLARELTAVYPRCTDKLEIIANPIDLERFERPPTFDKRGFRQEIGIASDRFVFSFLALGDFARKGLDIVIDAVRLIPAALSPNITVLVIGGGAAEVREYQTRAGNAGVGEYFKFVGFAKDPRTYLWASDVFVFPSLYEIFSLAILQAAAAGLPIIVTKGLYGAEEFIVDGTTGWSVLRTKEAVAEAMIKALSKANRLQDMSKDAVASVSHYSVGTFVKRWETFYRNLRP